MMAGAELTAQAGCGRRENVRRENLLIFLEGVSVCQEIGRDKGPHFFCDAG